MGLTQNKDKTQISVDVKCALEYTKASGLNFHLCPCFFGTVEKIMYSYIFNLISYRKRASGFLVRPWLGVRIRSSGQNQGQKQPRDWQTGISVGSY